MRFSDNCACAHREILTFCCIFQDLGQAASSSSKPGPSSTAASPSDADGTGSPSNLPPAIFLSTQAGPPGAPQTPSASLLHEPGVLAAVRPDSSSAQPSSGLEPKSGADPRSGPGPGARAAGKTPERQEAGIGAAPPRAAAGRRAPLEDQACRNASAAAAPAGAVTGTPAECTPPMLEIGAAQPAPEVLSRRPRRPVGADVSPAAAAAARKSPLPASFGSEKPGHAFVSVPPASAAAEQLLDPRDEPWEMLLGPADCGGNVGMPAPAFGVAEAAPALVATAGRPTGAGAPAAAAAVEPVPPEDAVERALRGLSEDGGAAALMALLTSGDGTGKLAGSVHEVPPGVRAHTAAAIPTVAPAVPAVVAAMPVPAAVGDAAVARGPAGPSWSRARDPVYARMQEEFVCPVTQVQILGACKYGKAELLQSCS